jgi:dihydrodipicolinate synthase/N-acetylneuraminate lyase
MKELYPLSGIITVLNTPFKVDNKVDSDALVKNVREAMDAVVAGFLVPAMASEVLKLTTDEKLSMVEKVMEAVNGRIPVFAGTASSNMKESLKICQQYQDLGCDHFLVQIPFKSEDQFKKDFYRFADLDPEVIMLQDWDANGYGLADDLIVELFEEVPAFRCLKVEIVPAGLKYSKILELTNGKLHMSGGWAVTQMPEALQRGVHAYMPTGMHWIYTRIFGLYQQGKIKKAIDLFNEILPVLSFSNQHLDISIHFFKRLLWKQGIYSTFKVREPILPFDAIHEQIADELIEKVIQIENRIKGE